MTTEWRFIKLSKYPDRIICDDGRIYNKFGKKLRLKPSRGGYLRCRMYKQGKECYTWVHRMVAYGFVGDVLGKDVHHKDKNTYNNHWWNFKILTKQEHYEEHKLANLQEEDKGMEQTNEVEQGI